MDANIICIKTDCEYFSEDCCDIDKTNCTVHAGYELLNGDCKEFINQNGD